MFGRPDSNKEADHFSTNCDQILRFNFEEIKRFGCDQTTLPSEKCLFPKSLKKKKKKAVRGCRHTGEQIGPNMGIKCELFRQHRCL